jgi:hypothetical protein
VIERTGARLSQAPEHQTPGTRLNQTTDGQTDRHAGAGMVLTRCLTDTVRLHMMCDTAVLGSASRDCCGVLAVGCGEPKIVWRQ